MPTPVRHETPSWPAPTSGLGHGSDHDTSADPAYVGVADMRDLTGELATTAHDTIVRVGDDESGG